MTMPDLEKIKAIWPAFYELVIESPESWSRILSVELPAELDRERARLLERTGELYQACYEVGLDWYALGEKIWASGQKVN